MNETYYPMMMERNRLVPITIDGHVSGLITFYIGNGNVDKYVRDDPWTVLNDEPETGTICYIDQLISNKHKDNYKYSWKTIKYFTNYIKDKFPQVKYIRWNRYKGGRTNVYYRAVK